MVAYYSIQQEGHDNHETDKFITKYADNEQFVDEYNELFTLLDDWGENGIPYAHRRKFRHENEAKSLPPYGMGGGYLRLYCYPMVDNILILGNGGHKVNITDTHQASPFLKPHFDFFRAVARKLDQAWKDREIYVKDNLLEGDLELWL
ncbi:MAG: hypothetical protein AAF998_04855 [Bacteroidota bacterium]